MIWFRDLPIRSKLILSFLVLIILPVITIGIFSFHTSKGLLKEKTEQYSNDILMETGENVDVKLEEIERLSFQIVSNMDIQQALRKSNEGIEDEYEKIYIERTIDTQLKGFLSPRVDIAAAQVISLSGTVYYVNPGSVSVSITDHEKEILEEASGGAVWFRTDPDTQTISIGRAINSIENQDLSGYVVIYLRERSIYNIYNKTDLFKNGDIFIADQNGRLISHKDKSMLSYSLTNVAVGITTESLNDNFITAHVNDTVNYVASRMINNGQWRIIAIIPTEQYEGDILMLRNWIMIICGVCCIFSLLISISLSESISKPLRSLSSMMKKVGKGDFSVSISSETRDEVGILSNHFNKMVTQVQKLIQEVYQEQLMKQKAELKSLRMQINPHFLYNTLESINWMARMKNIPEIGEMVKALGDLMRVSISGEDFILLTDEIENITNYLKIQKFRYGERFEAFIHMDDNILQVMIPKLTLQPIVENAIVHGLEGKVDNGRIQISGTREEGRVVIKIIDDGLGMSDEMLTLLNRRFSGSIQESYEKITDLAQTITVDINSKSSQDFHTHIGLINVDRRIKLYFGQEYGISITSSLGGGTCVKAVLPTDLTGIRYLA